MHDGTRKRAEDVIPGDRVKSRVGPQFIAAVHNFPVESSWIACLVNGFRVSPTHPVFVDGEWKLPREVSRPQQYLDVQCVVNFEIDTDWREARTVMVNGIECATLGWGNDTADRMYGLGDYVKRADALWGRGFKDRHRRNTILRGIRAEASTNHAKLSKEIVSKEHSRSEQANDQALFVLARNAQFPQINVDLILRLHKNLGVAEKGAFRQLPVLIGNAMHVPVAADEVPNLVRVFCVVLEEKLKEWECYSTAAFALWWVNHVHPFSDGNGRTARCLAFLVLCMGAEVPESVPASAFHASFHLLGERQKYFDGLVSANEAIGICHCCAVSTPPHEVLTKFALSSKLHETAFLPLAALLKEIMANVHT